ncbi:Uncharacterized protein HZ326_29019 [Fusarium oxysporum f. sp. albedinis]|nr:Uncharacterized protein HZ326_29019 [Fusarium oxysporum f. sp. albedinis]
MLDLICPGLDCCRTEQTQHQTLPLPLSARPREPVKLITIPIITASYNDEINYINRGDKRSLKRPLAPRFIT